MAGCPGKKEFWTKAEARREIKKLKGKSRLNGGFRLYVYWCDEHHCYHLTKRHPLDFTPRRKP